MTEKKFRWSKIDNLLIGSFLLAGAPSRLWRVAAPKFAIFDEAYTVPLARAFLDHNTRVFDVEPPLASVCRPPWALNALGSKLLVPAVTRLLVITFVTWIVIGHVADWGLLTGLPWCDIVGTLALVGKLHHIETVFPPYYRGGWWRDIGDQLGFIGTCTS